MTAAVGTKIKEEEEAKMLLEWLTEIGIDYSAYEINIEHIVEGKYIVTYEELQFILGKDHTTQSHLKDELASSELVNNLTLLCNFTYLSCFFITILWLF